MSDGGFFSGFNIGDAFEIGLDAYTAREKSRAQKGSDSQLEDQNALINRPDNVTQRPNANPVNQGGGQVTTGSGQGSGSRLMLPGGLQVNKTALYIAGAALAAVVVLKVAK